MSPEDRVEQASSIPEDRVEQAALVLEYDGKCTQMLLHLSPCIEEKCILYKCIDGVGCGSSSNRNHRNVRIAIAKKILRESRKIL